MTHRATTRAVRAVQQFTLMATVGVMGLAAAPALAQEWPATSVATSTQVWPAASLKDGSTATVWSSNGYPDPNHTEWLAWWFGGFRSVNYVKLYPRVANGTSLGFPKAFNVYWSDGTKWNLVRTYTSFETPYRNDYVILPLPATVSADGIHVVATTLGKDDLNNYYFQLAEVGAGYNAAFGRLTYLGNNGTANEVEIRNMGSGSFSPSKMAVWNYDRRNPIITANSTTNPGCPGRELRNVYAPNVVYMGGSSWNVYFGGWDNRCAGNDTVSLLKTTDNFATFGAHSEVVSNGQFTHANNESVVRGPNNDWRMVYTTWSGPGTPNKPGHSASLDGNSWNPAAASRASVLTMSGYPGWGDLATGADVNGTNVLYWENGLWYLYWKAADAQVHLSTSANGVNFNYVGVKVSGNYGVNDVKKVGASYLWGYHFNTNKVWYSVGASPSAGPMTPSLLFDTSTAQPVYGLDPYVVAVGWVTDGARLLGALYGAGAASSLDQNRIFARWLQRKAVIQNASTRLEWMKSNGPNTAIVMMVPGKAIETATLSVYDSDGVTPLYTSPPVTFRQGDIWQFTP